MSDTLRLVLSPSRGTQVQIPKKHLSFFEYSDFDVIDTTATGVAITRKVRTTILKKTGLPHTNKLELSGVNGLTKPTVEFTQKDGTITYKVNPPVAPKLVTITLTRALDETEDVMDDLRNHDITVDGAKTKLANIAARVAAFVPTAKYVVSTEEELQEVYDSYSSSEEYESSYTSSSCW